MVTQPGIYTVTGTFAPGSCIFSDSSSITVIPDPLPVSILTPADTVCFYDPAIPLSAIPAGGTWSGTGLSGAQFDPSIAGTGVHYLVYSISDSAWCTGSDTVKMIVQLCLGVDEFSSDDINIFPNPARNVLNIEISKCKNKNLEIDIFNIYGQHVKDVFSGNPVNDIWKLQDDISELADGIYILKINGYISIQQKIVKNSN